jgi:signal transduction histidine kinase
MRDRTAWLLLLFVVMGVLVPGAAVVWFMNAAARSQAENAKKSVMDAWSSQLRFFTDRTDAAWKSRRELLDQAWELDGALGDSGADAVILLDPPPAPAVDATMTRADWAAAQLMERRRDLSQGAAAYAALVRSEKDPALAARAAEAQIRCLAQSGNREAAVAAIQRIFVAGSMAGATDADGRSIAADELLLAIHLLPRNDHRRFDLAKRLVAAVNNYRSDILVKRPGKPAARIRPVVPAAQRLFLMNELRAAAPELAQFPTYDAERLAADYAQAVPPSAGGDRLEPAGLPDLWKLTSPNGRVIGLYRTATVVAASSDVLQGRYKLLPPNTRTTGSLILMASEMLREWSVAVELSQSEIDLAARNRRATYLWIGYMVLAAIILTGVVAGQAVLRQQRITRLKTDLVAAVSHELKTPLAGMRLLVDTLLADGTGDPAKTREYLDLISAENLRLSRLIDNFLTFSRIERNRASFEFRAAVPAHIVETALGAMRERLRAGEVEVSIAPDLPSIRADEDALVTVLLNLLDNACKYTRGEKHIAVRASRAGTGVMFAVEDNGIGIAPRDLKRIFRRFYQVDRSLAREAGGCGLGLSIVEFIVRAHGGEVSVKSVQGQGSTFTVRLPAEAAA